MNREEFIVAFKQAIFAERKKKHRQEIIEANKQKHDQLEAFWEYRRQRREQKQAEKLEKKRVS